MQRHGQVRKDYHGHVRHDVLAFAPSNLGRVLDLGGGLGGTSAWLKEQGRADEITVLDLVQPSEEVFDIDRRYSGNIENSDVLEKAICEKGPFDTILCLDILEHLVDPWRIVKILHEGLNPGGCIISSLPNVRNYEALLPLVFKNEWKLRDYGILDRTHLRFFVKRSAIELMTSSGLKLESIASSPSGRRKVKLFRTVTLGLLNSFTDRQYIMVARREN